MSDQGSSAETNDQADGQGADGVTQAKPEVGDVVSRAEFEAVLAKNDEILKDNRKLREERKSRKSADDEARKKAGDYESMLKERDEELAGLRTQAETDRADAEAWRKYQQAEADDIRDKAKGLSDTARAALDAIPDIRTRRAHLDELLGSKPKETPEEHPAGEPSSPSPTEYSDMSADQKREKRSGWRSIAPVSSMLNLGRGGAEA